MDLPDDRQAIENKWIFKRKTDAHSSVTICYLLSMRWFSLEEERVMQQSSVSISLSF